MDTMAIDEITAVLRMDWDLEASLRRYHSMLFAATQENVAESLIAEILLQSVLSQISRRRELGSSRRRTH